MSRYSKQGYNLCAMKLAGTLLMVVLITLIAGCNDGQVIVSPTIPLSETSIKTTATATIPVKTATLPPVTLTAPTPQATTTIEPILPASPTIPVTPPTPTMDPGDWVSIPVIPVLSDRALEIYQRGIEIGNNPHAFSKVGDCGSTPAWFLGDFDRGPKYYRLGEYQYLEPAIEFFAGSFERTSLAAKSGFNASSVLTTLWANRSYCNSNETPLACEYRLHKPIMALIMLGTNDIYHQDTFEGQMRKIIEFSIESGVLPVLSTKADNEEGDGSINATIAKLAVEYQIPLWNYWLAVQPLPKHGLQDDGAHITWAPNRFDDPQVMKKGWPTRNLTALQILERVRTTFLENTSPSAQQ